MVANLSEASKPSLTPEKGGRLWKLPYGVLRHCQMLLSLLGDKGQGRDKDLEGALVQGPVFSQALAMSQDHWSPYLCGRKGTAACF